MARKKADKPKPSEAARPRSESDRRLRQADRLARILRTLQLLLSRSRWNARELAAEQECSERTIYRDLEVLELSGIFLDFDKDANCYRLPRDFRFPALNLTEEEILGQAAASVIAKNSGLRIATGTRRVTEKLAASSSDETAQMLADAQEVISVLDMKLVDHSRHRDTLLTIQRSLIIRKQVRGVYKSPYQDGPKKLLLHPYRLCLVKQAWYLIGREVKNDGPRTYRVPRFSSLQMTEANAEMPQDFDLEGYFGNAWAVYRGEEAYDIEIHFSKEAAIVTETVWHPTQLAKKHQDGSVTLTFHVDGLNEIVHWVLGWGQHAKVISPPELRTLVLDRIGEMYLLYATDSGER